MAAGNNVVSKARWSITSASQGAKRLRRVKSGKVGNNASREEVNGMGEDAPNGTRRKVGGRPITLEIFEEEGVPEVDWDALEDSGEFFSLTRSLVNGKRFQYPECQVSKVETDDDNEGSHMKTIEVIAFRQKKL